MSKHALSKIYEEYVSLLRQKDSPQRTLMPSLFELPEAESNKSFGSYYTPQYIARFFARYLQENLPPRQFRSLKSCDPACGSGIFLRTILELQCDPLQEVGDLRAVIDPAFRGVLGIDIDENASQATLLSLNLLYLVLAGDFPGMLSIVTAESLAYYKKHPELKESFDAVVANPPFVKWDALQDQLRKRVGAFLRSLQVGKPDLFMAQLVLGMQLVKPGGFLLYVLPHSFLLAHNSSKIRRAITDQFWVRFVADLSNISVFENVGAYVILLVAQRKLPSVLDEPTATVVKCTDFPGNALQDALDGKRYSSAFFHIYDQPQSSFQDSAWRLLRPRESSLRTKLQHLPVLSDYLTLREGFVTGADDVFIRPLDSIPKGEEKIYIPFLADREMMRYSTPKRTKRVVFYPYLDGRKVDASTIREQYPKTWAYLRGHSKKLNQRKAVKASTLAWWCPERPRSPENMLRPKIVSPHLVLEPRFSLDATGKFAVSRSPLMYPISANDDVYLLRYMLALLNSSIGHWQITNLSHKYSRGYAMLEKKLLSQLRVPSPESVPVGTMRRIQSAVDQLIRSNDTPQVEIELDRLAADIYGLSRDECQEIGLE